MRRVYRRPGRLARPDRSAGDVGPAVDLAAVPQAAAFLPTAQLFWGVSRVCWLVLLISPGRQDGQFILLRGLIQPVARGIISDDGRAKARERMISRHRIYLLIAFLLASGLLAWLAGKAELAFPLYLLGSWGLMLGAIGQTVLMRLFPNHGFALGWLRWLIIVIYLFAFVLYLLGLMKLNDHLSRRIRFPLPTIPMAIHSTGSLLCWWVLGITYGKESIPSPWYWVFPIAVITVYFLIDWQLTLRAKRAGGMVSSNGMLEVK